MTQNFSTWNPHIPSATLHLKIKEYDEGLKVYNYCQISSPKNSIADFYRGLILDADGEIICRPFDRFYNYGESKIDASLLKDIYAVEKLDGSLIKVYYWNNSWRIATRGTAFAESNVGDYNFTFETLTLKALNLSSLSEFNALMNSSGAHEKFTYLFELTSPYNRVVTPYSDTTLWFLAKRANKSGIYCPDHSVARSIGAKYTKIFLGKTLLQLATEAKSLTKLKEGFVVYDYLSGAPLLKIKSPTYVTAHLLRGEGLSQKRILDLIIQGEVNEYLTYFPEDRALVETYLVAMNEMLLSAEKTFKEICHLKSQKEFALEATKTNYPALLFQKRKNPHLSIKQCFDEKFSNGAKHNLILAHYEL